MYVYVEKLKGRMREKVLVYKLNREPLLSPQTDC